MSEMLKNIDFETATLEEIENLDLDHFLGGDVSDFDIGDALPDGVYGFMIDSYELAFKEAKPEEGKKSPCNA